MRNMIMPEKQLELWGHREGGVLGFSECGGERCSYFYIKDIKGRQFKLGLGVEDYNWTLSHSFENVGANLNFNLHGSDWYEYEKTKDGGYIIRPAGCPHLAIGAKDVVIGFGKTEIIDAV